MKLVRYTALHWTRVWPFVFCTDGLERWGNLRPRVKNCFGFFSSLDWILKPLKGFGHTSLTEIHRSCVVKSPLVINGKIPADLLFPNFRGIQHHIWINHLQLQIAMPCILRSRTFNLQGIVFYRKKHFGLFFLHSFFFINKYTLLMKRASETFFKHLMQ